MTFEEKIKRAKDFRKSAMLGVVNLEDKFASEVISLYPMLKYDNKLIAVGTRINFNGRLFKAAVDLWDTVENNPENASELWTSIEYKDGYRIIPEVIAVSAAFAIDEIGWWQDKLYKSLLNINVYTPEEYPAGWELV